MYFVGSLEFLKFGQSDDAVAGFYGSVYPRLLGDVGDVGEVSRVVGFRAYAAAGGFEQFFGIETGSVDTVPDGLVGWELGEENLSIKSQGRLDVIGVKWLWREETTGEFCSMPREGAEQKWLMTTNCPITKNQDNSDPDIIELVDYNPDWPVRFELMKSRLLERFGDTVTRIEHYGSTAVPGMPAKPVIDILVEVPSFEIARREFIPRLSGAACEYWWYTDHIIFIIREKPFGRRSHHIHIAAKGHRLWEGVAFRDYLIANPDAAVEYAILKRQLSAEYCGDREKYTDAKTDFIRQITDTANAASSCNS